MIFLPLPICIAVTASEMIVPEWYEWRQCCAADPTFVAPREKPSERLRDTRHWHGTVSHRCRRRLRTHTGWNLSRHASRFPPSFRAYFLYGRTSSLPRGKRLTSALPGEMRRQLDAIAQLCRDDGEETRVAEEGYFVAENKH